MRQNIHIELEIDISARWHAGSGESSIVTDRLVRRTSEGCPFIPASTLRGVVRQSCEKLARTLRLPKPSDPHDKNMRRGENFIPFKNMHSPVDRLFGTKLEPSSLFFRDARMPKNAEFNFFTRNRVARYRMLGTTRPQQLFSSEYARPTALRTSIDGWHQGLLSIDKEYPPYAYCVLIGGILAVDRIGSEKSTGAGKLKNGMIITNCKYNGKNLDWEEQIFTVLELSQDAFETSQ